MPPTREVRVNVGIDAAKQQLDVFIRERDLHFNVANDPEALRHLLGRVSCYPLARVVL